MTSAKSCFRCLFEFPEGTRVSRVGVGVGVINDFEDARMAPVIDDIYLSTSTPMATRHWKVRESYEPAAVELKGSRTTRTYEGTTELVSEKTHAPLPRKLAKVILAVVFLIGVYAVGRTAAIGFFHLHNFNQPSSIGGLPAEANALTLANPTSPQNRSSFSQTYGDGTNQLLVLAVQSKTQTYWNDAQQQAILSQVHATLDTTSTTTINVGGADMSCSTGDKNNGTGFISLCFWTDYDIRVAVVDMSSSSPAEATIYAVGVKDAIEQ